MKKIHLCYENDRGTVPPYFWRVEVDGKPVDPKTHNHNFQTTEEHAEDMVVEILKEAGVEDTSNIEEWHRVGYDFEKDSIGGFGNWPYSRN
jgi:hypothetical protein